MTNKTQLDLRPRIGMDLGGTKIEGVVMAATGEIIARQRRATPQGDYDGTLAVITDLVGQLARRTGIAADTPVGIGTPGKVSAVTGLMKNCNSTCLNNQPLAADLTQRLQRPVRLANDADCFTLSEASDGAAGAVSTAAVSTAAVSATVNDTVFGVILGTGVGGGLVNRGALLSGSNAICGEWGHITLPRAGYQARGNEPAAPGPAPRDCFCGRSDCVETWLSGPAFERSYHELTGEDRAAPDIAELLLAGNPHAVMVFQQYCNLLALGLSTVINIVDPRAIVFGGGLSKLPGLINTTLTYLPRYVFSDTVATTLLLARHGDASGVRGAAWLWPATSSDTNPEAPL